MLMLTLSVAHIHCFCGNADYNFFSVWMPSPPWLTVVPSSNPWWWTKHPTHSEECWVLLKLFKLNVECDRNEEQ